MQFFNGGLDALGPNWATDDYEWRAVKTGTFHRESVTVSEAISTGSLSELSQPEYDPAPLAGASRTIDGSNNRIVYTADNPQWAGLIAGETINAIMLVKVITSDSDSIPVGWWALSPGVPTNAADPLIFELTNSTVAYTDQVT